MKPTASDGKRIIEWVNPNGLRADKRNARKHPETQIAKIVGSIKEFGFTIPLLVDEKNSIIAGHGRQIAAMKMGLESVPIIRITGLSEKKKQALMLADNHIPEGSIWDMKILSEELESLFADGGGLDLESLGLKELMPKPYKIRDIKKEVVKNPKIGYTLIGVPVKDFGKIQGLLDEIKPHASYLQTAIHYEREPKK